MGICASCPCLGRGESESEASRLLDDDPYQISSGYGATGGSHLDGPEAEMLRREREALDAICQRTSDSVIDIWARQPQTYQPPLSALPSLSQQQQQQQQQQQFDRPETSELEGPSMRPPMQYGDSRPQSERSAVAAATMHPAAIGGGEFGGMRYIPLRQASSSTMSAGRPQHAAAAGAPQPAPANAASKHWAEVVTTTRRGKKKRLGLDSIRGGPEPAGAAAGSQAEEEEDDVFKVLEVK
ncbi:hypothetical protein KEM52_003717 [Ascosphaera acerosa]|nr:hypothetical protein KEM52_003717 [Ascosphaera acerosa]